MSFIRTRSHNNPNIYLKNANLVVSQKNSNYKLYAYYNSSDKKLYLKVIDFTTTASFSENYGTAYNFDEPTYIYTRAIDFHECQDWNESPEKNSISVRFGYIHHNGEDYVAFATTGLQISTGYGMRCNNQLGKYYILKSVGDLTSFTDALSGSNIGATAFIDSDSVPSYTFNDHSGFIKVVDVYIPKIGNTPYVLFMVFYEDRYVLNLFFLFKVIFLNSFLLIYF